MQRTILIVTLIVLANSSVAKSQRPITELRNPTRQVQTSCLTEIRSGKRSCWGIVIEFKDARFKSKISSQQLKIYEAKHGSSLQKLMSWSVSNDGRRLTIVFKPGTGDFGSGNKAEITLYRTAFVEPPKDFPAHAIFVQKTDLN